MNDRALFAATMEALRVLPSPGRPLSAAGVEVYWRACSHLTDEEFQRGAERCLMTCRYFPVPSELIKAARIGPDVPVLAAESFAQLARRARRNDLADRDLEALAAELFGPAAARALKVAGGGRAIRAAHDSASEHWVRKTFIEHYHDAAQYDPGATVPALPDATPERVLRLAADVAKRLALPAPRRTTPA